MAAAANAAADNLPETAGLRQLQNLGQNLVAGFSGVSTSLENSS